MAKFQELLAAARKAKGVSLREVERATGVSNAYISQMETGAVAEPSPHKLQVLAKYYGLSYGTLMNACGYMLPSISQTSQTEYTTFMGEKLTTEESAAMGAFLHELRRRTSGKKSK
jgi:HTH-type transcriptional regulator, competence development regulator